MSVTAFIRRCLDVGMPLDMALKAAEAFEQDPPISKGALRTRRYRERKTSQASQASPVTLSDDGDKEITPEPPKENTPIPPLKGGTFPKASGPAQPEKPKQLSLQHWTSEIWANAPLKARQRSGKQQTENALKAAVRQGADPAAVANGLPAYWASRDATKNDAEFMAGVHRAIQRGLWQSYAAEPETPVETEDPWPRRLLNFRVNGYWDSDWGPKPGKPDYRGPPQDLAA